MTQMSGWDSFHDLTPTNRYLKPIVNVQNVKPSCTHSFAVQVPWSDDVLPFELHVTASYYVVSLLHVLFNSEGCD